MGLKLKVEEKETKDYEEGTVFYQSRPAGGSVVAGATLRIHVAVAPEVEEEDIIDEGLE